MLISNINLLQEKCKSFIHHLYIIDNASNLPKSLNNDFVTIIYNKNLGGSGGYARGMYEAKKNKELTHILIMDDDIQFDPKILIKAVDTIKQKKNDDWLGFSMMKLDEPNIQFEMGAYWSGIRMHNINKNLDLSIPSNVKKNVPNKKYNYSAWWSLIMPISVIKNYGYPMPFFIKFDDIEYGLRRKKEKIIFSNEYKIWHQSFDKKFQPYLEYYLVRNAFITNALHFRHAKFLSLIRYLGKCTKYYFMGRFQAIRMANLGCKEYFYGPKLFLTEQIDRINQRVLSSSTVKINIFKSIICVPFSTLFYSFKIIFNFNKVKKEFLREYPNLISEEYWKKQFFN